MKEARAPRSPGNDLTLAAASARLKKLRRERYLVERAIVALTELALSRQLVKRRATRSAGLS
jgi:hypothetical protein